MDDIQPSCNAIGAAFNPRRNILLGSHAYGKPNKDSDVDVLVVMPKRVRRDTSVEIRFKVRCIIDEGFHT